MRSIDELDVTRKRVLLRADLNVPLHHDGAAGPTVADDNRIRAALETIEDLRARGARIVLASHLGRPHGRDPELSMRPVAKRIGELTAARVSLAPGVVGELVAMLADRLVPGEILLLENLRYEPGEKQNDPAFARELADLADVYVNDAFGTVHRAHASTEGVAHLLPCAAGRLIERELRALSEIVEHSARPLVAVLGGAKVSDKLPLVERFLALADSVLIGGAMSFPFLAAEGHTVGASPCPQDDVQAARAALAAAAAANGAAGKLMLPDDLIVAERLSEDAPRRAGDRAEVPDGWLGLDIGLHTIERYVETIAAAGTVFWNGPMGAFECAPFAAGTNAVASAIAGASAKTVVGGGETVEALRALGLERRIDHVSTGGGATLEYLQGLSLPGLLALEQGGGVEQTEQAGVAALQAPVRT